ncbi:ankyrin repeat domain-containing protein [Novilysobacter arseniciresistens]|uniref:ankyrin repeat domain-containing protein n=1 Tax=Novilysobacter arseniciresistens TaxID=1385522 RepID=UPI0009DCAEA2|nr:ankyrin repeat domain-containing protein [Lysobacter arseniciresistens]
MLVQEQHSALHLAAIYDRPNTIRGLVRHGQFVDQRDNMQRTALHWAGSAEVARALLANGAKVDALDANGLTPLHTAQNMEVALVLIDAGADVDARSYRGVLPDQSAAEEIQGLLAAIREERAVASEVQRLPVRLR